MDRNITRLPEKEQTAKYLCRGHYRENSIRYH